MIDIHLDIKPLSINQAWQGKRFKTPKYDKFIKESLTQMPTKKLKLSDMIHVSLVFGFSSKLADIDNGVKPILDILTKKYGIDDRYIYGLEVQKKIVPKGQEYINITIRDYLPFN